MPLSTSRETRQQDDALPLQPPQTPDEPPVGISARWIWVEVLSFVVLAVVLKYGVSQFTWRFAGPISLILTLCVLTAYLRMLGIRWSDLGMRSLPGWKPKLMLVPQVFLTGLVFAGVVAVVLLGGTALGLDFLSEKSDGVDQRWGDVQGNLPVFLLWLGIVWTAAAFGEEMFFRGYLVTRLRDALPKRRVCVVVAVILPALLFGLGHYYYQGLRGVVMTGSIGLVFGSLFVLYRNNLWPLVLWHGIVDSLTFTAMFMDWDI